MVLQECRVFISKNYCKVQQTYISKENFNYNFCEQVLGEKYTKCT